MFVFIIVTLVSGLSEEKTDDYCYLFASNYVQGLAEEIQKHVEAYPELDVMKVTSKAIEQAFYSCIRNLKTEHVKKFNFQNIHDFSLYSDFINLDLGKFVKESDLTLTKKFNDKRKLIAERARNKSKDKKQKDEIDL
jgi:hypothetical protein